MTTSYLKYIQGIVFLLLLLSLPVTAFASSLYEAEQRIAELINQQQPPDGIVFELISRDKKLLNSALPAIQSYITRLKQAYPDLEISVVSHGPEMFALSKDSASTNSEAHKSVQGLVSSNIEVHVCGAYAEYKGISEDVFPEYVDVAPHGPELIRDYLSLGYLHIKIVSE